ncbi:MAG: nucleotidyltransferase domain-containing protein [Candidatus Limnocylindrales bacterium]
MTGLADGGETGRTLADPLAEALRIVALADERRLLVRLMGGLAFHAQAPAWTARVSRADRDIDLATRGRDRKALAALLEAEGYTPDTHFNTLFGHKQLYFVDQARRRPVDVLVDAFEMCHRFELAGRLPATYPTLPLAELLLSKLQVVKINRKDVLDALILLAEHPLGREDGAGESGGVAVINTGRIVELTSKDWGWWRTVTGNIDKLADFLATELREGELDCGRPLRFDPAAQVVALRAAIDAAPKSSRWKLRSTVGDRVGWYMEPEEVGH